MGDKSPTFLIQNLHLPEFYSLLVLALDDSNSFEGLLYRFQLSSQAFPSAQLTKAQPEIEDLDQ